MNDVQLKDALAATDSVVQFWAGMFLMGIAASIYALQTVRPVARTIDACFSPSTDEPVEANAFTLARAA
ncbi:MAG TPA: hypothetical protein VMH91_00170 [Candidatus Paceibacterota bacterium]|nr:hypothetical protein [Candidatus Paceibacterota bacterium]